MGGGRELRYGIGLILIFFELNERWDSQVVYTESGQIEIHNHRGKLSAEQKVLHAF